MEIGRTWTIWRQTPGSESQFHGHVHQGNDLPSSFLVGLAVAMFQCHACAGDAF